MRASLLLWSMAVAEAVWPAPQSINVSKVVLTVRADDADKFFEFEGRSPLLEAAFARYAKLMFPHAAAGGDEDVTSVAVRVDDLDESAPQLATDESYELDVVGGGASSLRARTVYGALRGLETLSQLVTYDFDGHAYTTHETSVVDAPRFRHRGLMIDSGRHFQPLASIFRVVDSLPFAKVNVLHWHLVDTQSFPFESTSMPELWEGAFSKAERYTQDDVKGVVEYARLRGVRVIPEFDMPGHAQSWCVGRPDLCPSATCTSPLDVSNNATFERISGLLDELRDGLFLDDFVHLGGDEVDTACWTQVARVKAWLDAKNLTGDAAYALFTKTVAGLAIEKKKRPVQWSEVWDHFKTALPKDVVIHVWKSVTNVTDVVAAGYDVIRNVGYDATSWYLDNLNVNASAVYLNEPCDGIPDDLCEAHLLGGHGEMWGETVDASDIDATVWPRLGAIAEKLWSPKAATVPTSGDMLERLADFRCLLNARGIRAAPVYNADARAAPPGPGSCFTQR